MAIFKCKMCGGTLEISENQTTAVCEYCGTQQTLPKLDDEQKANLYDRANHFRRNNEFDKAMSIYENILNEDSSDAEAYWSLVLCRYGIEYVEDPTTKKRMPTVNRAQFTSVFDDDNYKSALENADMSQRAIYEAEAKAINEIQKGILAISQKEEPFDVFICYKETDNNGRRTPDSVLANDLYYQLTQEGFKVFFSRITLEDKLGTAYEPYIFAALNSAKVMVVLGTRPEYFKAVWVKNEWSRYLALVKQSGGKKVLIPAYRDMDPYDLPEEFSHLQAQDMGKLGFMQDLIRGIKKLTQATAPKVVKETVVVNNGGNANIAPLLKRAFLYLEDGDWDSAKEYCEKVLDADPECAEAYLGELMAELHCRSRTAMKDCAEPFDNLNAYRKATRFADVALADELIGTNAYIRNRNEQARIKGLYEEAEERMRTAKTEAEYREAANTYKKASGYKDADNKVVACLEEAENARKDEIYATATVKAKRNTEQTYKEAAELYRSISGWRDADVRADACRKCIEEMQAEKERKQALRKERARKRGRKIRLALAVALTVIVVGAAVMYWQYLQTPESMYEYAFYTSQTVSIQSLIAEDRAVKDGVLTIPDELGGYKVKTISSTALRSEKVHTIVLPASVTFLPDNAFEGLPALKEIVFEADATSCSKVGGIDNLKKYQLRHQGECAWSAWVYEDGFDCTKGGNQTRSCKGCDATEARAVAAGTHTVVVTPEKVVTCTEVGYTRKEHCSICEKVLLASKIVPALGHNWVNNVCTHCSLDADKYYSQIITEYKTYLTGDYAMTEWIYHLSTVAEALKKMPSTHKDAKNMIKLSELLNKAKSYDRYLDLFSKNLDTFKSLWETEATHGVLTSDSLITFFLLGEWKNSSGYYLEFYAMNTTDNRVSVRYNLPYPNVNRDYYDIEDALLVFENEGSSEQVNVFKLDFIDADTLKVYCYKDGSTYTLTRQ